jgi:hypothetical protein
VTSLDELKLRIVAAIETLENTWREMEDRLYMLHAAKGAHVEVV